MSLQNILEFCSLDIMKYEPVYGGDINHAYSIHCKDATYFLKVNNAHQFHRMFEKEARGLQALDKNRLIGVLKVIKQGVLDNEQYLLLEWIDKGKPSTHFWENFGRSLATLHQQKQSSFGWIEDNFIGSLIQHNQQQENWCSFYMECRIFPLVKTLFDSGSFDKQVVSFAESFYKKSNLFPDEAPSLLHGDLWNGNFMVNRNGEAIIFDPAVYCGHREMDLGMTKLFGGFDDRFYYSYNEVYPLEKNWQERLPVTQLYPLLVHAVLFSGHYTDSARNILKRFS